MKIHDKPNPERWNMNVKTDFDSTHRRLSENLGAVTTNRGYDAVDRDIWIMGQYHGERGENFLKEWNVASNTVDRYNPRGVDWQ